MSRNPISMPALLLPTVLAALLGASVLPAASADPAQPAAAQVESDNYLVAISASGSYTAGAAGSVTVSLTAKAGFHINDQYPYRFKTAPPAEGISYPKPILERADGQFEEKTAHFNVPFVASHAGKFAIGGVLNLSVCSPTSCIVQKAPLDVTVTVQ
jgi:hypothetical protein